MMALGKWPFSPAEIRSMLEAPLARDFFCASEMFCQTEPWPHMVHYRGTRVTYIDPKTFLWTDDRRGPSDCVWIVPGTAERRR